jgi:hypothetical protein
VVSGLGSASVGSGSGVSETILTMMGVGVLITDCAEAATVFDACFIVIIFLQLSGVDEYAWLLSRIRQDAPSAPMVV